MQPLISVITCTHNPREDYLEQVLAALKTQTLGREFWEYVIVDNASAVPVGTRLNLSWHPQAGCIREEKKGLTNARLRGIEHARGELLVFVDDDNVLDADYLEQALGIFRERPMIGAWSGQNRPVFEESPPAWTKRHWGNLAIREFEGDRWSNLPHVAETSPNGAGLCVRKQVARFYLELHRNGARPFLLDRNGDRLVSGGDVDLATCACDLGLGVGVFAALKLKHLMPAFRLKEDYLLRLTEGIGYSGVILNSFRPQAVERPSPTLTSQFANILRLMRMNGRERRFHRAFKRGEAKALRDLLARPSNGQQ